MLSAITLVGLIYTVAGELTAVSDGSFVQELYRIVKNEDAPSARDLAATDALIRKRICDEISGSGFFDAYQLRAVSAKRKLITELKQPKYVEIFRQIYQPTKNRFRRLLSLHKYTNYYRPLQISSFSGSLEGHEYIFVCLLKKWSNSKIVPYYVSKEYNLDVGGQQYKAGRFVFEDRALGRNQNVILAEEPGVAYERLDFNVELYYLQIRENHEPAENDDLDPLCRLVPEETVKNQHYRLCTAILTSSYFKNKLRYPTRTFSSTCSEEDIYFRTDAAKEAAAGETYSERMISCLSLTADGRGAKFLYISRAYVSGQVFVYLLNLAEDKLYLENLTTNVDIVREPPDRGFNDVE